MRKSFLSKMLILIIALAAVLAVITTTMRSSAAAGIIQPGRTQSFLKQFVISGGPIVWFVLLPMSLVMVYLAVEYSLTIRRKKLLPEAIGSKITAAMQQYGPGQIERQIAGQNDFVSIAVVEATAKGRGDWFRMRSAVAESLQEQASGLLRKIEWISLIGNVSPMVGLFGTVFGMIKLFNAIVLAGGQPQPAQLAEGISVALVTTFWGLLIAIPALAVHGVFRNRIETLISDAVVEAEDVMLQIKDSLKKQAQQPKQKQPIQEIPAKSAGQIRKPSVTLR